MVSINGGNDVTTPETFHSKAGPTAEKNGTGRDLLPHSPAVMPTVKDHVQISAPAEDVWATVRDFGAINDYVPSIVRAEVTGEGIGATRTLTLEDGTEIVERLDAIDEDARTLRYSIAKAPLPIENYESLLSVKSAGDDASEVRWASTFETTADAREEMTEVFEALYAAGLEGLRKRHAPEQA